LDEFKIFETVDRRNVIVLHLDDQVDHRSLFTQSRCGWITRAIGSPERRRGLYPAENFGRS